MCRLVVLFKFMGTYRLISISARGYNRDVHQLGSQIGRQDLCELIQRFLYDQQNPNSVILGSDTNLADCPLFSGRVYVYPSAVATFYAPSDLSGIGGMHCERIRAVPSWHNGPARYDCVFAEKDPDADGFRGLHAAQVMLFFRITVDGVTYPCALLRWFVPVGDDPDDETGMWIVEPDIRNGKWFSSVVHLDCILRGAHLIGVSGSNFLPEKFPHTDSLDSFQSFYVNKYADHHSYEIAF
jgi:hypothetical protein